jgi:hypothetical protein
MNKKIAILIVSFVCFFVISQYAKAENLGTFYLQYNPSTDYFEYIVPITSLSMGFESNFIGAQNNMGGCSFGGVAYNSGDTVVIGEPNNTGCYASSIPPYEGTHATDMNAGTYIWRVMDYQRGNYYEVTFYWSGTDCVSGCEETQNLQTRFISITPYYGEATSTGIVTSSIYGYINPIDLANANGTMTLTSAAKRENPLITSPHYVQVDILSSGYFFASGTTTIDEASIWSEAWVLSDQDGGNSGGWWQSLISNIGIGPYNLGSFTTPDLKIYLSTSTRFKVGNLSPAQQAYWDMIEKRKDRQASTTAAYDLTSCGLFSDNFSMEACIYSLIIPSSDGMYEIMQDAQAGFLMAAPWGYITHVIDMINASTSTSTLPLISYTFPSSFPVFGDMNFHFDPYAMIAEASDLVNNEFVSNVDGSSVWDIFGYLVNLFFIIVLIFKMFEDISGLDLTSPSRGRGGGKMGDGNYEISNSGVTRLQ